MTTYEEVNNAVESYYNNLREEIEAGDVTKEDALKRVSAPFIFECLRLTNPTVANLHLQGFERITYETVMKNVLSISELIYK